MLNQFLEVTMEKILSGALVAVEKLGPLWFCLFALF